MHANQMTIARTLTSNIKMRSKRAYATHKLELKMPSNEISWAQLESKCFETMLTVAVLHSPNILQPFGSRVKTEEARVDGEPQNSKYCDDALKEVVGNVRC
jgi:hypothetical protein